MNSSNMPVPKETELIISGLKPQPRLVLRRMRDFGNTPHVHLVPDFCAALNLAKRLASGAKG